MSVYNHTGSSSSSSGTGSNERERERGAKLEKTESPESLGICWLTLGCCWCCCSPDCCLAFNILRQHANLILNLLSLMGDANIPDLSSDVEKNLYKVQEKFRLDLSDTEADGYIQALIDQSVSALFPQVLEKIHKWALYWRSFSLSTSLALADGAFVRVGDVKVGSLLRGSDDRPVAVTEVYRGMAPRMYRLMYDGGEHTVTPNHLVVLRCGLSPSVRTRPGEDSVVLRWLDERFPTHYSQLCWRFASPRFALPTDAADLYDSADEAILAARRYGGLLLRTHGPEGDNTLRRALVYTRCRDKSQSAVVTDVRLTLWWLDERDREDVPFPFGAFRTRRVWPVLPAAFQAHADKFALWFLEQLASRQVAHPLRCGSLFEMYAELLYRARGCSVVRGGHLTLARDPALVAASGSSFASDAAAASADVRSVAAVPSSPSSAVSDALGTPASSDHQGQSKSAADMADTEEEDDDGAEEIEEYAQTAEERAARREFDAATLSCTEELAKEYATAHGIAWVAPPELPRPSVKAEVAAALAALGAGLAQLPLADVVALDSARGRKQQLPTPGDDGPIPPSVMPALQSKVDAALATPAASGGRARLRSVPVAASNPPLTADFVYMLEGGDNGVSIAALEKARTAAGVSHTDDHSVIVELVDAECDAESLASMTAVLAMQPLGILAFGQSTSERWRQGVLHVPGVLSVQKISSALWMLAVAGRADPIRLSFARHPCMPWSMSSVVRTVHAAHGLPTDLSDTLLNAADSAALVRFDIDRIDGDTEFAGLKVDGPDGRFMLHDGVMTH